jgi:PKD repeat protein
MKKIIMIMAVATALFSCGQKQDSAASSTEATKDSLGGMMTSTDAKSLAVKAQIKAYTENDSANYGVSIADNVKLYFPNDTVIDVQGKAGYVSTFLGQHKMYENINVSRLRVMTITLGNGETWTDTWAVWSAKGRASGKEVFVPIHIVDRWDGDKIVGEYHFWDNKANENEAAAMAAAAKK